MVMIRNLRPLLVPALLAAAGLASCVSAPSQPRKVPFPGVASGDARPSVLIDSYENALTAVLWVMENELGFPPLSGSLELYSDRVSLEAGLVGHGYEASYARQIASKLDGLTRAGQVLANDSALRWQQWPARITFLAHETTHVAEYALANGRRGASEQWLREGFAEWASWRVIDSLQLGSFAARRRTALVHLREAGDHHELPAFSELVNQSAWVKRGNRKAADPMYDQALLATELLIQRNGVPALLEYFRLFASSDDPLANFRAAFREERQQFEMEFQIRLKQMLE